MSKRREAGDWVWLKPNSGFVGESNRLKAQIAVDDEPEACLLNCDDPNCREWPNLATGPDYESEEKRWPLYHVSECQMLDEPWKP